MKVTIIQLDIEWGRPQENINKAEQMISSSSDSDLYVLPEMWGTGFATDPLNIAEEENDSLCLTWMQNKASELGCSICGSLAIKDAKGLYRNRHYFIDGRNNLVSYYDKHHLFTYGHENQYYTQGEAHTVVEYDGFRFLLLTCYDLRFPLWCRYSSHLEFDAIIVVANWPESRQNAWQILTRARAIENQAYLIGCNRVGNDSYNHYRGLSAIVNPIGKTLASCKADIQQTITVKLEKDYLLHQRSKFKVLEDRDTI